MNYLQGKRGRRARAAASLLYVYTLRQYVQDPQHIRPALHAPSKSSTTTGWMIPAVPTLLLPTCGTMACQTRWQARQCCCGKKQHQATNELCDDNQATAQETLAASDKGCVRSCFLENGVLKVLGSSLDQSEYHPSWSWSIVHGLSAKCDRKRSIDDAAIFTAALSCHRIVVWYRHH